MKNLIKKTKKEIKYSLKEKKYSDAELLARTLHILKSIRSADK